MTSLPPELLPTIAGQALRGDMLDAFARIETAINRLSLATNPDHNSKTQISAKLDGLAKQAKAQPSPFAHPGRIAELLIRVRQTKHLRDSLVHSIMEYARFDDGSIVWRFRNLAEPEPSHDDLWTTERFRNLVSVMKQLAKEMNDQQVKPKSAPAPVPSAATSATA